MHLQNYLRKCKLRTFMVQLNLNLMLVRIVPASNNTRSTYGQPGSHVFLDLHANGIPRV